MITTKMYRKFVTASLIIALAVLGVMHMSMTVSDTMLKSRVVKLVSDRGSCSGEQVRAPSGIDYILTAGHCATLQKNGQIEAITEDGRHISRRVIEEDQKSDLLLLEGVPHLRGLDIAVSSYGDQHVRTFTHGAGMATYQTDGRLIKEEHIQVLESIILPGDDDSGCVGKKHRLVMLPSFFGDVRACVLEMDEMVSTAFIVPGSSGGMVVDDSGDLVGVVSAGGDKFGYFVLLRDIKALLSNY